MHLLKNEGRRLFKVQRPPENVPRYFDDKREAKKVRARLVGMGYAGVTVKRGPDHWKGETP